MEMTGIPGTLVSLLYPGAYIAFAWPFAAEAPALMSCAGVTVKNDYADGWLEFAIIKVRDAYEVVFAGKRTFA